jgi:hypothetical protein
MSTGLVLLLLATAAPLYAQGQSGNDKQQQDKKGQPAEKKQQGQKKEAAQKAQPQQPDRPQSQGEGRQPQQGAQQPQRDQNEPQQGQKARPRAQQPQPDQNPPQQGRGAQPQQPDRPPSQGGGRPPQRERSAQPQQPGRPQSQGEARQPQQGAQRPRQASAPSPPTRPVQPAERTVWQEHRATNWQSEHQTWQQRGGYTADRIPEDRYRGAFGPEHTFRIYSNPVVVSGGYPGFQYGGFWFSIVDPWPEYWSDSWYDSDDVYIDYFGDGYYLYNRRYPRDRIAIGVYINFVQQGERGGMWLRYRARSNWQSEHRSWQQRGGYKGYRIPDDRYRRYFGGDHGFRLNTLPLVIVGGYPRFQYAGFWFSVVDPWPEYWSGNWYDSDDVYIDYFGDGYYMYNRRYPRDRIAVSVYLH